MASPAKRNHGKKRPVEDVANPEETSPKRGLWGRTIDRATSVLSRSTASEPGQRAPQAPLPTQAITQARTPSPTPEPTQAPPPAVQLSAIENARAIANYIDAKAAERTAEREEQLFKDPSRKLKFNINIGPKDDAWIETREKFIDLLKGNQNVGQILRDEFEEKQILYLMPPPTDGIILDIQNEHAKKYKAMVGKGGRFHGVPDNLPTKLAMLHFGLSIEPMTYNNIANCGQVDENGDDIDKTDEEDTEMPGPRYERVTFAEKPLEFLDKYSDGRSYGYPKLRGKLHFLDSTAFQLTVKQSQSERTCHKPMLFLPSLFPPKMVLYADVP
jgi:hypothetical protein